MEKYLANALQILGCNAKEIRFFIACYSLGASSINDIARSAKVQRSTAYLVANSLIEKGLLVEDHKDYKKLLVAVEPTKLSGMLRARQRQFGRRELDLEDNMAELQAIYQATEIRPRVRTFEGANGLLAVWRDILNAPGEILMWTNQETEGKLFTDEFHDQFIAQRIANKLPVRVLAVSNKKGRILKSADADSLRETKLLPDGIEFGAETYIYGSKVAILDHNKDIIGVIIESNQVHLAQKAMFETAWSSNS